MKLIKEESTEHYGNDFKRRLRNFKKVKKKKRKLKPANFSAGLFEGDTPSDRKTEERKFKRAHGAGYHDIQRFICIPCMHRAGWSLFIDVERFGNPQRART